MLNLGAWLSWQAIKALVPKAPPWLGWVLAAVGLVLLIGLYGYHLGSNGKAAAIAETNLEWTAKLDEQNRLVRALQDNARRAGEAEPATPADDAGRVQLCRQSPTCREH